MIYEKYLRGLSGPIKSVENRCFDQLIGVDFNYLMPWPYPIKTIELSPWSVSYSGIGGYYVKGYLPKEALIAKSNNLFFSIGDVLTPEQIESYNNSWNHWEKLDKKFTYKVVKASLREGVWVEYDPSFTVGPVFKVSGDDLVFSR